MSELITQFFGLIVFLGTGFSIGLILFKKVDLIERLAFSLALSIGYIGTTSTILYLLNLYSEINLYIFTTLSIFIFILFYLKRNNKIEKLNIEKNLKIILVISTIGFIWRLLCQKYFEWNSYLLSDSYAYSFKFVNKELPDLGFYTGIAKDKSHFFGNNITENIVNIFDLNSYTILFLSVFFYTSFSYLFFKEFKRSNFFIYSIVLIIALGPIELFYAGNKIFGHSLSYLIIPAIFLSLVTKVKNYFYIVFLLCLTMMNTYYTSNIIFILFSTGILISITIKSIIENKINFIRVLIKNKIFINFTIILIIFSSYILFFSGMSQYSIGRFFDQSDRNITKENIQSIASNENEKISNEIILHNTDYKDPTFLHLSAIRWQIFILCLIVLFFSIKIIKKVLNRENLSEDEKNNLILLLPVILVSIGFLHVNLPARIFDYFAFFFINLIYIKNINIQKTFSVILIIIFIITGALVARDKKIFFVVSKGEVEASTYISENIKGKIFSDQVFINQLILKGYYDVTGANEKDKIVHDLFFQNDKIIFESAVKILKEQGVKYIAISKRMKDKYILMLNYPKRDLITENLFDELETKFENSDLTLYSI